MLQKLQPLLKGFDASRQHVVLTDREGVIVYANKAAEEHTGYLREEMIGKKPGELWGGHMSDEFYKDMWETIAEQKQAFLAPMHNKKKNGEQYWQEVHILPVLSYNNEVQYFLGIELDINDAERREELLHGNEKEKGAYHVQWPTDWLFEAGRLNEEHLKQLQDCYCMDDNCIESLVDDLITISGIHFAAREDKVELSPYKVIGNVLAQMESSFSGKKYSFQGEETAEITENVKLFEEFLKRIILNASRYTNTGTGTIALTLLKTGTHCIIKCEDNGIGISAYEQKHIYDKFFRGAEARKMYPQGAGLGLHIAKTIATAMNWELSHVSEKGAGALFEVRIPLQQTVASANT